jgi:hypothetical protein
MKTHDMRYYVAHNSSLYSRIPLTYDYSYHPPLSIIPSVSPQIVNVTVRDNTDPMFVELALTDGWATFGLQHSDHFNLGTFFVIAGVVTLLYPIAAYYSEVRGRMLESLDNRPPSYEEVSQVRSFFFLPTLCTLTCHVSCFVVFAQGTSSVELDDEDSFLVDRDTEIEMRK